MSLLKPVSLALLAIAISACSATKPASSPTKSLNNEDWYQVRTENELYLFDDYSVFRGFIDTGKAPYLKTLDEKDKWGKTVVLGLSEQEKDQPVESLTAYRFLKVSLPPTQPFYGELRQDGMIYVFRRYGDMIDMYNIGEPTFRYTDIGGGPEGERVIYVLAKEEKLPADTIAQFKAKYQ